MRLSMIPVALCCAATLAFGASTMQTGKVTMKSAGALAIGPDGVLFVGDSVGAAIYALDVNDRGSAKSGGTVEVTGINDKIAALLSTTADQIAIRDVVVNPRSKNIYVAVARGKGPDAIPVILRVDSSGKLSEIALDNIKHASVTISDTPTAERQRMETITQLKYVDGKVMIAGLSNEEFSSSLRSIPYPFQEAAKGTSGIEIFHGAHGRFETNAPVRTFVPYEINKKAAILAAYTCTPLVTIPVSDLKSGAKVKGTTIAELGAGNRPIDMIVYQKGGKNFILMANSSRGVMKLSGENLDTYKPIVAKTDITGVPYETIADLKGVTQLDKFDDASALVLIGTDLRTVALP
jgi:hypothetical protein